MTKSELPYRPGVGVVLFDDAGRVFVGRRVRKAGEEVWQFPQGGIDDGESALEAAYRELHEETGIPPEAIELTVALPEPITYDLPADLRNPPKWASRFRGQQQHWFAFRFNGTDEDIDLDAHDPEFDAYRWVKLEDAMGMAVDFKRDVYRRVGETFAHLADEDHVG